MDLAELIGNGKPGDSVNVFVCSCGKMIDESNKRNIKFVGDVCFDCACHIVGWFKLNIDRLCEEYLAELREGE